MITLYHGSDTRIEAIDLSKSQMHKDFGRGFYLSAEFKQAMAFAKYKAAKPKSVSHKPFVSSFIFDELSITDGSLRVMQFSSYTEAWIDFIDANRAATNPDYDLVIGPIADDQVRTQFVRYKNGEISKAELLQSLKYKRLTFQYCFITPLAISKLRPL